MRNPVLSLTLPLPPSINHYWNSAVGRKVVTGKHGKVQKSYVRVYLSEAALKFRHDVIKNIARLELKPITGRVMIEVTHHPKTKAKIDIDNLQKGLNDALTHAGVWIDDSQIDKLIVTRGEVISGGLCRVEIFELTGDL